jgi:hypothetical protein
MQNNILSFTHREGEMKRGKDRVSQLLAPFSSKASVCKKNILLRD